MSLQKQVQKIDVDLYEYHPNFCHDYTDIHVTTAFIDSRHYNIIITRLDQPIGWNETLKILIHYREKEITNIITVDPSPEKTVEIKIETDFDIYASTRETEIPKSYSLVPRDSIPVDKMSKDEFEIAFDTEIYAKLPDNLYAVGFKNGRIYMYNEKFGSYFEIVHCIKIIARVFFATFPPEQKYHFVICANDGYFEQNYHSLHRTIPKVITEYNDGKRIVLDNLQEYPVFYKNKWILGMSNHLNMPFTIDTVDRHYIYCNLYNPFRSFHRGIPFRQKKNQIIFGCRVQRGGKYNFLTCKTEHPNIGEMSPRQYFYTDHVCKDNVVYGYELWIDNKEMVNYKYILDVDGNACTWDATAWKLNSGSVIMKTKSPWRQWFYDDYIPWVHYIPIADDFSDLQEKYHWCEDHPVECERMIVRCKDLFQKTFRFNNIMTYVQSIFERTPENLSA
jgi:hypothetical protein